MKKPSSYQTLTYNPKLTARAKRLRQNLTYAKVLLWNELKQRKLRGLSFHRQRPIGEYIVVFFNKDLMLVIEVDGQSHDLRKERDARRQRDLESLGLTVLRFWNSEVKTDIRRVVQEIEAWVDERGGGE